MILCEVLGQKRDHRYHFFIGTLFLYSTVILTKATSLLAEAFRLPVSMIDVISTGPIIAYLTRMHLPRKQGYTFGVVLLHFAMATLTCMFFERMLFAIPWSATVIAVGMIYLL